MSIINQPTKLTNKREIIELMESNGKPEKNWKIGIEYEKFAYTVSNQMPLEYYGAPGIETLFKNLCHLNWEPIYENSIITKLKKDQSYIFLEPGGQIELASTPQRSLHDLKEELISYTEDLVKVGSELGISYLTLGYHPNCNVNQIPRIPNPNNRFRVIEEFFLNNMGPKEQLMFTTCASQVSLDYSTEKDMVSKYRLSMAIQPLLMTIFSNSPYNNGKQSGYFSYRNHIWNTSNLKRNQLSSIVFDQDFNFEKYVDYLLDTPLLFIYHEGEFLKVYGETFNNFLKGELKLFPGKRPTIKDWEYHIGTIWPDVRLKNVLEIRGVDSGSISNICALSALCVGILYDQLALESCWDIFKTWDANTRSRILHEIPYLSFDTKVNSSTLMADIAKEILNIAHTSLTSRSILNTQKMDESYLLNELWEMVISKQSPSHILLNKKFHYPIDLSMLIPF